MTNNFTPTHPQNTIELVTNEVQKVTLTGVGAGKTFKLAFDGEETAAIAITATAAVVLAALEAISNIQPGDVTVSGSVGGPFTVTFTGRYAKTNVPQMTGTATEGTVTVTTVTSGSAGVTRGTGNADATTRVSPLSGESPVTHRAGHASSYGD